MRRIAGALAALLVCVPLVSCDGGTSSDGVLRFGLAYAPRNLDPRFATDAVSERVNRLLYRRLVEFDRRSLPVPGIANWERLTPARYRFRLGADGRAFSDGTRLTSADVAATYASILEPASGSPHRALLSLIRRIDVPDSDTVDFELETADPLFPAYLGIGILPSAGIGSGHPFAERPIGSGPFLVRDRAGPGRLRLERRSDGQPVELVTVRDPNVRVMKLLRGEIQMLQNDLSPELVDYLADQPSVRVDARPGVNFSYLGFNLEDPVTGRAEVRRAIAHAVDRAALLRHLFGRRGRTAEALFPPDHWAGTDSLAGYAYDPGLARALLAEAGFGADRPLRLTLKTSSDPFRVRLATALQAQLAEVGIDLAVRSYDWGTFFGDVKAGRFQIYGLTWVGVRTPDIFRYAFHSASVPPDGANRGRYRSAEADRLIESARAEPLLTEQATVYRALQALLHADLPYLPLWYEDHVVATRPEVAGYQLAADGNYDGLLQVRMRPVTGGTHVASR